MRKKSLTNVLAENLRTLMDSNPKLDSDRKLAKVSGVSHKTINNILSGRHQVLATNIEKLAAVFGIEAYQLLCPVTDTTFIAIAQAYSVAEEGGRDLLLAAAETVMRKNAPGTNRRTAAKPG